MGKKVFVAAAFNQESESFVVHIASLSSIALPSSSLLELDVYPFHRLQVSGLIIEKTHTNVLIESLDFADIFSSDLISKQLKHTGINDHAIKLIDGQ